MLKNISPDLSVPATSGLTFSLAAIQGRHLVLYFYPKDNTPGCTSQAQQFRDLYPEFLAENCVVIGVSRDSLKSHENFKSKFTLPFELVADTDESLCLAFGVMKQKMMYGKQVRGIERSTFVFDATGVLRQEWRGVKVVEHAAQVLTFIQSL
ncbi:MAG: peroxiredoxin, partial [Gallionella sp.]